MFAGSFVAIVTPFSNGAVNEKQLADLINWQIESGTHGIVACGTTGESPTLSHEEHGRVIEYCVEVVNGRVPVIAGTGSNSTDEAISLTRHAAKTGADAALMVSPYYNKPTQEGIFRHFTAIADSVDIPILIYNIPGRTASTVSIDTLARLSSHKNIAGVKDAVGDLNQTGELIAACGSDFVVLSGDDSLTLPMMALGGRGVISTTANVIPDKIAGMVNAALKGEFDRARELHYENLDLMGAMFYETNPIPVKTALAMMGKIDEEFRLPICPISQTNRERLQTVMKRSNLI